MLPTLNAVLNAVSAVLLTAGYLLIRRKRVAAHRGLMLAAFAVSTLFLISYVTYHAQAGSRAFPGRGWIRPAYFTILITHISLAFVLLPMALTTLFRAWRGQFERHNRIARWTFPIWIYISLSGVAIYWMLYGLF